MITLFNTAKKVATTRADNLYYNKRYSTKDRNRAERHMDLVVLLFTGVALVGITIAYALYLFA